MHIGTVTSNGTIEAAVLMDGHPQPLYQRPWDRKVFVAGIPGRAYTLRARNLTGVRVEVVTAIDGRNILRDERADKYASRGEVVAPHTIREFTGWRVSDDETRPFVFGAPERSIAAQATGSVSNVGVIGFAAYRERAPLAHYTATNVAQPFLGSMSAACAAPGGAGGLDAAVTRAATSRGSSLGTGMGSEVIHDHVGTTHFTRATGEPDLLVIGYVTQRDLAEMGLLGPPEPEAFPGAGTGYEKYAPAP